MTSSDRVDELAQGISSGDRRALARGITLLESTAEHDRQAALELLARLEPAGKDAYRIGVTGAPGVGKSTFIDAFGMTLIEHGLSVAVLTIDPTGIHSGGSILGDKTRMMRLAGQTRAFVRPSPSGPISGGVASSTAEAVFLCEAAGYDAVIVESVGVGQREHDIRNAVDFLLLLVDPGAGDELQGLKRGILEVVDCIAVNKADGAQLDLAEQTRNEYATALAVSSGQREVLTLSAWEGKGIDAIWQLVQAHHTKLGQDGERPQRRGEQRTALFWQLLRQQLLERFVSQPAVACRKEELLVQLQSDAITPRAAVQQLLKLLDESR